MDRNDKQLDFTKQAADHLREMNERMRLGSTIGSGHAHMLVAAYFGYNSRKAMLDAHKGPDVTNQWLSHEVGNVEKVKEAIGRMNNPPVQPNQALSIVGIIRDGLTPACLECDSHNARSTPLGHVEPGDDADWVCIHCASDDEKYGHCPCCGGDVLYRLEELDGQGLCEDHQGEFDLDPEEEEDWESYIENVQNNS